MKIALLSHVGKVIGMVAGGLASQGHWMGIASGFVLGATFDYLRQYDRHHPHSPYEHLFDLNYDYQLRLGGQASPLAQAAFFRVMFTSLGCVAKADGLILPVEIAYTESLMQRLGVEGPLRQKAIVHFNEGKNDSGELPELISAFLHIVGTSQLRVLFLETLVEGAFAAGELPLPTWHLLQKIAFDLDVQITELEKLIRYQKARARVKNARERERFEEGFDEPQAEKDGQRESFRNDVTPLALQDAYEVLGVSIEADDAEMKLAYRRLMSRYHPDKLVTQGLSLDEIQQAKEKAQSISRAYNKIMTFRRL